VICAYREDAAGVEPRLVTNRTKTPGGFKRS
jgi:hypothetical protein